MGVMRFLIHPQEVLEGGPDAYRAYLSGMDGRVWPTRVEIDGNLMTCRRTNSDSARLNIAWPVPGFGRPVVCTSSLMEREPPYLLAVELARGKISQVRDQLGAWQIAGMVVPEDFFPPHRAAHRLFARAAALQGQPEQASKLAAKALTHAFAAADSLTRAYTRQRLLVRRRRGPGLPILLGCHLGPVVPQDDDAPTFCEAFNAASVPVSWRHIEPVEGEYHWEPNDALVEWCRQHKLFVSAGPLLDFSAEGLPHWLWQWQDDFFNLQSFFCDFVETALTRYIGRVRHWEVAARANTGGGLTLTEEQRLTLVARTLEIAREVDDEIQLVVRVSQPWGEYQARGQHRLSPLHFVDALVRSGVGLSGVNLEIAVGYQPCGSASRDLLEFSKLIDLWSTIGVPIQVTLAFPSSADPDPLAETDLEVEPPHWKADWSEAAQADWIADYASVVIAKPAVMGLFWAHFNDAAAHEFPHAGLLRADGSPKPALQRIIDCRHESWAADEAP